MSRQNGVQPTERANIAVVSVRLSKADATLCQERAERLGVGISTYIRMLVRQHLEREGAYRSSANGEEAVDPASAALRRVSAAGAEASPPRIRIRRLSAGPSAKGRAGRPSATTAKESAHPSSRAAREGRRPPKP